MVLDGVSQSTPNLFCYMNFTVYRGLYIVYKSFIPGVNKEYNTEFIYLILGLYGYYSGKGTS